jgi:hypothetical protein
MQRYISRELTHFVGRTLPVEDQFAIFCKVLSSGWLTHPPHNPHVSGNLTVRGDTRLSTNEMYSPQVVCFCDIPLADLHLHIRKYSPFGIAFPKQFLLLQGAAPVFYIPRDAMVKIVDPQPSPAGGLASDGDWERYIASQWKRVSKATYFDEMASKLAGVLRVPRPHEPPINREDLRVFFDHMKAQMAEMRELAEVDMWLGFHVFSFMKFFDATLPDDDPDNYYFEREWRAIGNVRFTLDDVVRVCLPSAYARRFRQQVPDYYGQIAYVDQDA